jgi:hypothetical protein
VCFDVRREWRLSDRSGPSQADAQDLCAAGQWQVLALPFYSQDARFGLVCLRVPTSAPLRLHPAPPIKRRMGQAETVRMAGHD